jgi:hypothetical protein
MKQDGGVPCIGSDPDGAVFNPGMQQIFTSNRNGTFVLLVAGQ